MATIDTAIEKLFASHGAKSATYTPKGGTALTVTVLPVRFSQGFEGESLTECSGAVLVEVSDLAEPGMGDSIKFDGNIWTVKGISGGAAVWRLELTRDRRPTYRQ